MEKNIIEQNNYPPALPNTPPQNFNNFSIDNQPGAVINFNYYIIPSQPTAANSAEQMISIQSFNREYYQLIVTCEETVFINNIATISTNKALTKDNVPVEIFTSCSTLTETGIKALKKIPAIICQENTDFKGITSPEQYAVYAYLNSIKVESNIIKIEFHPIALIQQQHLCKRTNASYFDLNMDCAITDLNRTGWFVHKVNLFTAFKQTGLNQLPMPNEEKYE